MVLDLLANKNYIVEGSDNVGKSTLIKKYFKKFKKLQNGAYYSRLQSFTIYTKQLVSDEEFIKYMVIDRSFISELIYGWFLRYESDNTLLKNFMDLANLNNFEIIIIIRSIDWFKKNNDGKTQIENDIAINLLYKRFRRFIENRMEDYKCLFKFIETDEEIKIHWKKYCN